MVRKIVVFDGHVAECHKTDICPNKVKDMRVLKRLTERTYVALINDDYVLCMLKLLIAPQECLLVK